MYILTNQDLFEGKAKQSEVKLKSIMKWWKSVITKTASRNIAFEAAKMSETALETQAAFVTILSHVDW